MKLATSNNHKHLSWYKESWKEYTQLQQPEYENQSILEEVFLYLNLAENLVSEEEIKLTQSHISDAAKGKAFILHAGDCAESFASCYHDDVIARVLHLKNLSHFLQNAIHIPVVTIGRIAGQYAKPRSEEFESRDGILLPCYRGDMINGIQFSPASRAANPIRLQQAFQNSKLTMDWIRQYLNQTEGSFQQSNFYTSHEAFLLNYESSLTHKSCVSNKWYHLGSHYLWLGERTRKIHSAHVEYLRGISNPIGIKIGPNTNADELMLIIEKLNPNRLEGKINLITRIGANNIFQILPTMILKISQSGHPVAWSCDPMHGNSYKTANGVKTRHFNSILKELNDTYQLHKKLGSYLAGIHLELTYQNVTECLGGEISITEEILHHNYQTYCDPRLNQKQSYELLNLFAQQFKSFK